MCRLNACSLRISTRPIINKIFILITLFVLVMVNEELVRELVATYDLPPNLEDKVTRIAIRRIDRKSVV